MQGRRTRPSGVVPQPAGQCVGDGGDGRRINPSPGRRDDDGRRARAFLPLGTQARVIRIGSGTGSNGRPEAVCYTRARNPSVTLPSESWVAAHLTDAVRAPPHSVHVLTARVLSANPNPQNAICVRTVSGDPIPVYSARSRRTATVDDHLRLTDAGTTSVTTETASALMAMTQPADARHLNRPTRPDEQDDPGRPRPPTRHSADDRRPPRRAGRAAVSCGVPGPGSPVRSRTGTSRRSR